MQCSTALAIRRSTVARLIPWARAISGYVIPSNRLKTKTSRYSGGMVMGVRLCRPSEAVLDLLPDDDLKPFTKEDGEVVIDAAGQRVKR